jgi:hypothetical protein
VPYIKDERRDLIVDGLMSPSVAGELNFALSQVIKDYLKTHATNYQTYNDVIGVLEALKLEIYRRLVAPYEDTKIIENGDVF